MTNTERLNAAKLKIKAMSLAEEAKIIRRIEKQFNKLSWTSDTSGNTYSLPNPIQLHRVQEVRWEARATHLARACIAGKKYKSIEASRKPEKYLEFDRVRKRVKTLVKKYNSVAIDVDAWINE